MKRKALTLLLALAGLLVPAVRAQQPTPLPLNPAVKSGKLDNGLSYYILRNAEPKQRANFYIAQKVGSTLETPEQLGLAHFLEHMAFNGTEHYPGKAMLNYLQDKGIRFGADINAYTSFDETVYNINNVSTTDQALMDSVLLVLRDWSGSILLEESEIDAERGVIQEEWRQRNDAQTRMYTAILPDLYDEYQYEQMPIGKMEVVMNFKPEVLRAYYKKWYRPDQQGIVIVGDFDPAVMEQKVKDLFSSIPMPENAAERTYPVVSDNTEPRFSAFQDPELQQNLSFVCFKYDKFPFEVRSTVDVYIQESIIQTLIAQMINTRLEEYSHDPNCNYAYAGASFSDYFVSKTKGAFQIVVLAKDEPIPAIKDAMAVISRACKTGFTPGELERASSELLSQYEKAYNEREKTDSEDLAREIIRHFIDNEATPGIEIEYQLVQQVLPMLPLEAYNETAKTILTPTNQAIVVSQRQVEGKNLPTREEAVAAVNDAINAEYEAYVDEVITEPLIAKLPKPGKIKSESANAEFGTHTFILSNGVKVVVKPTDFSADEILFSAFREDGKQAYDVTDADALQFISDAYEASKIGPFDVKTLKKYLAGKQVSLGYDFGNYTDSFNGMSTVKDLQTLMELIYASFTDLNPDKAQFDNDIQRVKGIIAGMEKNPAYQFQKNLSETIYGNNPMEQTASLALLEKADYDKTFGIIKNSLKNAADFTFIFTGNIDIEAFKTLCNQYLATLPSTGKHTVSPVKTPIDLVSGKVDKTFTMPMETPAVFVSGIISGDCENTLENFVQTRLIGDVLDIIYTKTLREEEGGTYGASTYCTLNTPKNQWMLQYVFQTGPADKEKLVKRANEELLNLLKNGATAEDFNKVKEAAIQQLTINMNKNQFWSNNLNSLERGFNFVSGRMEFLQSLTLEAFNKYMSNLYNGQNSILVIEEPAAN